MAFDPLGFSNNFLTFVYDFNRDGWPDILVLNFPGLDASWYENPKGKDTFWVKHQIIDSVASESPNFVDLNNDGIPELVYVSSDRRLAGLDPILLIQQSPGYFILFRHLAISPRATDWELET